MKNDSKYLKDFLNKYNLRPNKLLGQNFLINEIALQDIVDSLPLKHSEAILEIGPGIGNLTEKLLPKANFVLAIEKDKRFFPLLKNLKMKHKNFQFEIADILQFNFHDALAKKQSLPAYHVVANIPYYITGKIIQLLIQAEHKPKSITILVQKEVAQNIIAKPGKMNLLAISVQLYGEPKLLFSVPAKDFYPMPKVDSAVVQILLGSEHGYLINDEKKFFKIIKACFAGKRKQIHNTLANNLRLDESQIEKILNLAQVSRQARPQELSIDDWISLAKQIDQAT